MYPAVTGSEPEEVVLSLQGYLICAELPPITTPARYRCRSLYLEMSSRLTGSQYSTER